VKPQKFTTNKQVVRDLQCETIQRAFPTQLGKLSYFGLTSSSMEDVVQWAALLNRVCAVERGEPGHEWQLQNLLLLNAFKHGLSHKITLFRGDIDLIITTGKDQFGNAPSWPFDIVSLDYSGGLFYRSLDNSFMRLEALKRCFDRQWDAGACAFVLLLSFNLDQIDQAEVRSSIAQISRDLKRFGHGGEVIDKYLRHPKEQPRMKLYVLNLVSQLAAQSRFDSVSEPPILYAGNRGTEMMAFRFVFARAQRTFSPARPRERLNQLTNRRMIEIIDGKQNSTNLGLPMIKADANQ
jgi:hypothetical protein